MADLYIARQHGADDDRIVRIDCRNGADLLCRIEVQVEDLMLAIMGMACVPCAFLTERDKPGNPAARR